MFNSPKFPVLFANHLWYLDKPCSFIWDRKGRSWCQRSTRTNQPAHVIVSLWNNHTECSPHSPLILYDYKSMSNNSEIEEKLNICTTIKCAIDMKQIDEWMNVPESIVCVNWLEWKAPGQGRTPAPHLCLQAPLSRPLWARRDSNERASRKTMGLTGATMKNWFRCSHINTNTALGPKPRYHN